MSEFIKLDFEFLAMTEYMNPESVGLTLQNVNRFIKEFPHEISEKFNPATISENDGYFILPDCIDRMERMTCLKISAQLRKVYVENKNTYAGKQNRKHGFIDFRSVMQERQTQQQTSSSFCETEKRTETETVKTGTETDYTPARQSTQFCYSSLSTESQVSVIDEFRELMKESNIQTHGTEFVNGIGVAGAVWQSTVMQGMTVQELRENPEYIQTLIEIESSQGERPF